MPYRASVFMPRLRSFLGALLVVMAAFHSWPVLAQQPAGDSAKKLPIPRFVSLRTDKVGVRQGPSHDHPIVWTFTRAGLPVEITAEFDNWRRIRDAEGSEGWVRQGSLSRRRTALVAPWQTARTFDLLARSGSGEVKARVESGVLVSLRSCDGAWCRVSVDDVDGFMKQDSLWGVYPDDRLAE